MNFLKFFSAFKEGIKEFARKRHLKSDILIKSLSILIVSIVLIVGYSYYKTTNTIFLQARQYLKSSSVKLKDQIFTTLMEVETIVNMYASLLEGKDLTKVQEDSAMVQSMSAALIAPQLTSLYFGTPTGTFFEIVSMKRIEPVLRLQGLKRPENTTAIFKAINRDKDNNAPVNELWYYLKGNKTILPPHMGESSEYDPRKRDWFISAAREQKLQWSNIYVFTSTLRGETGITASRSITDVDGTFRGVFAADITLRSFSEVLAESKVSKNSRSYVINEKDQVISTSDPKALATNIKDSEYQLLTIKDLRDPVLEKAIEYYKESNGKEDFFYFSQDGEDYIAAFEDFPKIFTNNWKAIVISHLDDFVGTLKESRNNTLLYSFLILLVSFFLAYRLARKISTPIVMLGKEADKIRELDLDGKINIVSNIEEIQDLTNSMNALKKTIQSFSYYIPKTLVYQLINKKQPIRIGGRAKEVTLLFSDVANFTTISEGISADNLAVYLSDYFEELTKIMMNNNGTVDKYIGDAIMAFWGAPLQDRHHAFNSCRSALLAQSQLTILNRQWKREQRPVFNTRIGIHTGEVIIGNIGSSERMNYTAIGDSVNLASRLEGLNKYYGTKIMVSETVYDHVKSDFLMRPLDLVAVKGKTKPIKVYELVAQLRGDNLLAPTDEQIEFCVLFEKAYKLFLTRQWKTALEAFKSIPRPLIGGDLSVQIYIKRSEEFLTTPPPQDWDGVVAMTSK